MTLPNRSTLTLNKKSINHWPDNESSTRTIFETYAPCSADIAFLIESTVAFRLLCPPLIRFVENIWLIISVFELISTAL